MSDTFKRVRLDEGQDGKQTAQNVAVALSGTKSQGTSQTTQNYQQAVEAASKVVPPKQSDKK